MIVVRHILGALLRLLKNPVCSRRRIRVKVGGPQDKGAGEEMCVPLRWDRSAEKSAHVFVWGIGVILVVEVIVVDV